MYFSKQSNNHSSNSKLTNSLFPTSLCPTVTAKCLSKEHNIRIQKKFLHIQPIIIYLVYVHLNHNWDSDVDFPTPTNWNVEAYLFHVYFVLLKSCEISWKCHLKFSQSWLKPLQWMFWQVSDRLTHYKNHKKLKNH